MQHDGVVFEVASQVTSGARTLTQSGSRKKDKFDIQLREVVQISAFVSGHTLEEIMQRCQARSGLMEDKGET